jgi:hypothetical protein
MQGRRLVYAAVATALILWLMRTCAPPRPLSLDREADAPVKLAGDYDPARCGAVLARVHWSGPVPPIPPIELIQVTNPPAGNSSVPNPNAPHVRDGRLGDVIVYLTGIDARRSRPWDLSPVSVEAKTTGFVVRQGEHAGRLGVVRRGGEVELMAREAAHHSIRARGAAFFTQMLEDTTRPVNRTFPETGIVELSSGSGYYWLGGYLLVTDHPYAGVAGADGVVHLSEVPDGEYEAVCWAANWHVERLENDPEWVGPVRLTFRAAVERRQRVMVKAAEVADVAFTLSAVDFGP